VTLDLLSDAFRLALGVALAFYWLKAAAGIVVSDFRVVEHFIAAHEVVAALELHLLQFLFDLLLDAKELGIRALHGAHARLVVEFLKAFVVESVLAGLALHWLDQDGLAEGAEVLRLELVLREQVGGAQHERGPSRLFFLVFEEHLQNMVQ
jgi:hypothetical protein